ncbi:hypothetical protein L195_g030448 [Trifolium pratense]|uniref:Uncharacterized protein n=1 Tax=Trifolium pratense TaxID=57577 RepID=A0A2K3L7L5_TRIPR|nr:hypothetical protein L195_g030448 [Trifolium pratense]
MSRDASMVIIDLRHVLDPPRRAQAKLQIAARRAGQTPNSCDAQDELQTSSPAIIPQEETPGATAPSAVQI